MRRLRLRTALLESRRKTLSSLDGARDLTFIFSVGNTSDDLIHAATRRYLSGSWRRPGFPLRRLEQSEQRS